MDLKDKTVLVAGSGISGIGAVRLLNQIGAHIILYDGNPALTEENIKERIDEPQAVEIVIGELPDSVINRLDLAVLSPGVPTDTDFVKRIVNQKIPVWGEVELAYNYCKGRIIAITGTNGKTTTTALVGEIMKNYFDSVYVVGNIGTSVTSVALETTEDSVIVAEMSSFQLETIHRFHPSVCAVLNITPDHLNRHHTMEAYIEAKRRVMANQTHDDFAVLNYDDQVTRKMGETASGKVIYFSSTQVLDEGYYFHNRQIIRARNGRHELICNASGLKILGLHNMENVMAAVAMAECIGVPMDKIRETITSFMGVEHRIEFVTDKKGVTYYNDSKGTNTDAAIKAIQAMVRPTVLIGGGYDKEADYTEWVLQFKGRVKHLVLLGETAANIEACARANGFQEITIVESLKDAVDLCAKKAQKGDAVLLSPACASWGMFENYEERGRMFKEYVNQLED